MRSTSLRLGLTKRLVLSRVSVALAHEGELPSLRVLARYLIGEHLIRFDVFELAFWVLVEAADSGVTDTLTMQRFLTGQKCQEKVFNLARYVLRNRKIYSILTCFRGSF